MMPISMATSTVPATSESGARPWYVVPCRARQESRALAHLQRQGYGCFLPLLAVEQVRQGQRCWVNEPLFPGYLFVALDPQRDDWGPIRSTRGVLRVVGFGGQPVPMPPGAVAALQQASAALSQHSDWQPGTPVQVQLGEAHWCTAVFQAFDGERRALVLLGLLQQQHRVSVALEQVRLA